MKVLLSILELKSAQSWNHLVHTLRSLPSIRKRAKTTYVFSRIKKLRVLGLILGRLVSMPLGFLLLFLLLSFAPLAYFHPVSPDPFALALKGVILGQFFYACLAPVDRYVSEPILYHSMMKIPARVLFFNEYWQQTLTGLWGRTAAVTLLALYFEKPVLPYCFSVLFVQGLLGLQMLWQLRLFFHSQRRSPQESTLFQWILTFALVLLGFPLALLLERVGIGHEVWSLITSPWMLLMLLPWSISYAKVRSGSSFSDLFRLCIAQERRNKSALHEVDLNTIGVQWSEGDIKYAAKKVLENDSTNFRGAALLYRIFFIRFRSLLIKPLRFRLILLSLLGVGLNLLPLFISPDHAFWKEVLPPFHESIGNLGVWLLLTYLLQNTVEVVKSLFYNCDRTLTRYGAFRSPWFTLQSFFLRL